MPVERESAEERSVASPILSTLDYRARGQFVGPHWVTNKHNTASTVVPETVLQASTLMNRVGEASARLPWRKTP